MITSFSELLLPEALNKALARLKFETPTEVQSKTIPHSLEGKDVIACAETGSGKTAAYLLPVLKNIAENPGTSALILAPTRELAQQILSVAFELTSHLRQIRTVNLVGGADMRKQLMALKAKPSLIIATPGRLSDHIRRRSVNLSTVKTLVLDEGDRMLDMGFQPQIDEILTFVPEERQTLFFTATLPPKVMQLCKAYTRNPVMISAGQISQPVKTVDQKVVEVSFQNKDNMLVDELNKRTGSVVVFIKTKIQTDKVTRYLQDFGFTASQIHGGRTQGQRNKVIKDFKDGKYRILCATDVAARGIDIPHIEHVINYDIPMVDEDYVHRIGRTGRNGKSGEAISFVTPSEKRTWNVIAKKYQIKDGELRVEGRSGGGGGRSGKPPGRRFGGGRSDFRSDYRSENRSENTRSDQQPRRFEERSESGYRTRSEPRADFRSDSRPSAPRTSPRRFEDRQAQSGSAPRRSEGRNENRSDDRTDRPFRSPASSSAPRRTDERSQERTSAGGPSRQRRSFDGEAGRNDFKRRSGSAGKRKSFNS